jgi:hypothetical protein
MIRTSFRQQGTAAHLVSNQRYALISPFTVNAPGVLFDDLAHRRTTVTRPGCVAAPGTQITGGVVAFNCSDTTIPQPELYEIASRSWRSVALSATVSDPCGPVPCDMTSRLTGAGSRWLQFIQSNCPQGEHCSFANVYQNIQTGAVASDPAVQGGHWISDLDSPRLARRICSPITTPEGFNIFTAPGPGGLTFEGRFVLSLSPGPSGGSRTYLERCGTRLHQLIESSNAAQTAGPVAISLHAIVWQQSQSGLDLEFLPSRQRFRLRLPRTADSVVTDLALTANHLYVIDQNNMLWITPLPTRPPPTHRPSDPATSAAQTGSSQATRTRLR